MLLIAFSVVFAFALTVLCSVNFSAAAEQVSGSEITYVEKGSNWKYQNGYVEQFNTVDLEGSALTSSTFSEGKAPFGFCKYSQYDFTNGTVIPSTYRQQIFTKTFTAQQVSTALAIEMTYDEAIAIYLNGNEIYRDNIVGINFTVVEEKDTPAETVGVAEEVSFNLLSDFLVEGENVITVYLLQSNVDGLGAYFDLSLTGVEDFEVDSNDMPDTISQTFYDDPFTSRGITFYTGISLRLGEVRYREKGSSEWSYAQTEGEIWYGRAAHMATIEGLDENTVYEYAAGSRVLDAWSDTFEFKTESNEDANQSFKFSFFTDTQSSNPWQFSIWNKLYEFMKTYEDYDYDFHVHGGDIVESSVSETTLVPEQWRQGFNVMQEFMTTEVLMPVSGNHEYVSYAIAKHFNVKWANFSDSGTYYSFDYGNAHFTIINSNEAIRNANEFKTTQKEWIENDLASTNKEWKIAMMHFPTIDNTQPAHIQLTREVLMPLFAKYEVDLVLSGHTHQYFRSTVYAHADNLEGADQAATLTNVKNSAIAESDLITYTDLADGTIYTVNPNGVMYVTAKSSNYNVLYQNNLSSPSTYPAAHESVVFATNPLTGKVMNGGSPTEDTGYLMNKLQYVDVEVGTDTLKCNVYNIDYYTGERVLYDTYCVNKADSQKLDQMITELPNANDLDKEDVASLVNIYGLYGALGSNGISANNVSKIESLKAAISETVAANVLNLNREIGALKEDDLEGFRTCKQKYEAIPAANQRLVDTAKLVVIQDKVAVSEVEEKIKEASELSIISINQQTVDHVVNAYNALSSAQKQAVKNASEIEDLKAKIKAKTIIAKIDALKISPSESEAKKVTDEYKALTAKEKMYVENYDVLEAINNVYAGSGGGCSGSIGTVECGGFTALAILAVAVLIVRKRKGDRV